MHTTLTLAAEAAASSPAPATWAAVALTALTTVSGWIGVETRRTRKSMAGAGSDAPRLSARVEEVAAQQREQGQKLDGVVELAGATASALVELRDEYRRERLADQDAENARLISQLQAPLHD